MRWLIHGANGYTGELVARRVDGRLVPGRPGGRARTVEFPTGPGTLRGPDPYDLTADAVVRAVTRPGEVSPGAHTPATAFGPAVRGDT